MNLHRIVSTAAVATAAVLLSIGIQTLAYSGPGSAPPAGDASAPINTSGTAQTKTGNFTVGGAFTATGATSLAGLTTSAAATLASVIVTGAARIGGGGPAANKVLASSDVSGNALWKDPVVDLGLQKGVNGTNPCTGGSSIIGINPTTGAITCGKQIKVGTFTGKGAVTGLGFPDGTYAVLLDANGGSTDCRAAYATTKTGAGFTITAGDPCTGVVFTWVAIDY